MAEPEDLKNIIEAALLAAGGTLSLDGMQSLFEETEQPDKRRLREVLDVLSRDYEGRGIEIREVASGWRIQVRSELSPWVSRLWNERPPRYSRALMETLALIAYRQPITRGEIEDIRGVSVSSNIIKTLMEREWIRVVGHRDVPGRPSLFGTTREFLDYFNLKSLDDLPSLAEIRDLDEINRELELDGPSAKIDAGEQQGGVNEAGPPVPVEADDSGEIQGIEDGADDPAAPQGEEMLAATDDPGGESEAAESGVERDG